VNYEKISIIFGLVFAFGSIFYQAISMQKDLENTIVSTKEHNDDIKFLSDKVIKNTTKVEELSYLINKVDNRLNENIETSAHQTIEVLQQLLQKK